MRCWQWTEPGTHLEQKMQQSLTDASLPLLMSLFPEMLTLTFDPAQQYFLLLLSTLSSDSFKAVASLHWWLSFDSHKKLIILSTITFPVKYWKINFYLEYAHQAKAGGSKAAAEKGCFETLSHSPGRRARGPRAPHSHSQFISPHESWPLFA